MNHIVSFKANTTIPAYRIVTMLTGTGDTVKLAAAVTELPVGITTDTVLETALGIPVCISGIARLQFNETMGSGRMVQSDANGLGTPYAALTATGFVVGMLVGPSVSTTGTVAQVLVNPFAYAVNP